MTLKWVIKNYQVFCNVEIIIVNEKEYKETKDELVDDVLQMLNVYTAKMNGLKKYNKLDVNLYIFIHIYIY
jgi:predicted site-specific integrase-resolvase